MDSPIRCSTNRLLSFLSFCFVASLLACTPRAKSTIEVSKPVLADPAAIQDRALESFSKAIFYKPNEPTSFDFDINLAPLIVQEVNGPLDAVPRIAPYPITDRKRSTAQPPHSVVMHTRTVRMSSQAKPSEHQYVYTDFLWRFPGHRKLGKDIIPETRGVRVISTTDNHPLVWQVLDNRGGPTVLYVSTEVEKAAAEQFGPPLSGRKYSIERGLDENPNVIVARVISAGPVPMGPYVYLSADDQSVTSVFCRCMSSQVDQFVETKSYELNNMIPWVTTGDTWFTRGTKKPELNPEWNTLFQLPMFENELRWPKLPEKPAENNPADDSHP